MSKHVWRMHSYYNQMQGVTADEPDKYNKANCTLIPDAACFPVLEAMRLCRLMGMSDFPLYTDPIMVNRAIHTYKRAVARMKARKGEK